MMMMMMRHPSSLRVRAEPRHLPYVYIYIYWILEIKQISYEYHDIFCTRDPTSRCIMISSRLLRAWSTDISFTEADCWWISFPGFPSRKPKPSRRLWRPWSLVEQWPIWIGRHRGEIDEFPRKRTRMNQDEPGWTRMNKIHSSISSCLADLLEPKLTVFNSVQQCSTKTGPLASAIFFLVVLLPPHLRRPSGARLCDFSPFPEIRSQIGHQNIYGKFMEISWHQQAPLEWQYRSLDMPWYAVICRPI